MMENLYSIPCHIEVLRFSRTHYMDTVQEEVTVILYEECKIYIDQNARSNYKYLSSLVYILH